MCEQCPGIASILMCCFTTSLGPHMKACCMRVEAPPPSPCTPCTSLTWSDCAWGGGGGSCWTRLSSAAGSSLRPQGEELFGCRGGISCIRTCVYKGRYVHLHLGILCCAIRIYTVQVARYIQIYTCVCLRMYVQKYASVCVSVQHVHGQGVVTVLFVL